MATPPLLMVGAGRTGRGYLRAARELGVQCLVIERTGRDRSSYEPLLDYREIAGGALDEHWVQAAFELAERHRPGGVLAFGERHVLAGALAADALNLRGPGLRAATISRNKALQRAVCAAAGIVQPDWLLVGNAEDGREFAREVTAEGAIVVKALAGFASVGVEAARSLPAYDEIAGRRADRMLLERWLPGEDFSWEAFVADGSVLVSSVTRKEVTEDGEFVEIGHLCGPDVREVAGAAGDELGRQVIAAIGMRTGMVHLEFKHRPGQPAGLVEVAVRTPGGRHMALFASATGLDPFAIGVRLVLGRPTSDVLSGDRRPGAGATVVLRAQPGRVLAIDGLAEARAIPGVSNLDLSYRVGDVIPPLRSALDWVGLATVSTATVAERDAAVAAVHRCVRVRTDGTTAAAS